MSMKSLWFGLALLAGLSFASLAHAGGGSSDGPPGDSGGFGGYTGGGDGGHSYGGGGDGGCETVSAPPPSDTSTPYERTVVCAPAVSPPQNGHWVDAGDCYQYWFRDGRGVMVMWYSHKKSPYMGNWPKGLGLPDAKMYSLEGSSPSQPAAYAGQRTAGLFGFGRGPVVAKAMIPGPKNPKVPVQIAQAAPKAPVIVAKLPPVPILRPAQEVAKLPEAAVPAATVAQAPPAPQLQAATVLAIYNPDAPPLPMPSAQPVVQLPVSAVASAPQPPTTIHVTAEGRVQMVRNGASLPLNILPAWAK